MRICNRGFAKKCEIVVAKLKIAHAVPATRT